MINLNPFFGTPLEGGGGGGGLYWSLGAVEGGFGSVERDRHIRDLYSIRTKCCENPANRSEQEQHSRWPLSTFCMTDNNTVWLLQYNIAHLYSSGTFGSLQHCRAPQEALPFVSAVRQDAFTIRWTTLIISVREGEFSSWHFGWEQEINQKCIELIVSDVIFSIN